MIPLDRPPIVGRYLLLQRLPGGNFAETFVARDVTSGQMVVVKLLRDEYTRDPTFVGRFEREARHALSVSHPNVVRMIDTGRDGLTLFLVMEWVEGRDLKQVIVAEAPLAINRAVAIIRDVLAGLTAIHDAGIIHRDIKPQNILIDGTGRAKIADFGIARAASDTGVTHTGQAVGTAAYMAPEQATGSGVDKASDLYAVGVVFFELVTGALPFPGTNALRVMWQHVNEPPPRPQERNRLIPAALDAFILRLLAKHPAERFENAREAQRVLDAANGEPTMLPPTSLASFGLTAGPQSPLLQSTTESRRSTANGAAVGLVSVLALLLVGGLALLAALQPRGNDGANPGGPDDASGTTLVVERLQPQQMIIPETESTQPPTVTSPALPASLLVLAPTPAELPERSIAAVPDQTASEPVAATATATTAVTLDDAHYGPGSETQLPAFTVIRGDVSVDGIFLADNYEETGLIVILVADAWVTFPYGGSVITGAGSLDFAEQLAQSHRASMECAVGVPCQHVEIRVLQ